MQGHRFAIPFSAHSEEYEIRVVSDGITVMDRAFKGGRPANGFRYSVDLSTAADMERLLGVSAVDELVRIAKLHV